MRVALVHDWLTGMRGGEKVLDVLCRLYPEADLHTLVHLPGSTTAAIEQRRIVTSFLQRLPAIGRHYRYYLPLMPLAVGRFDLRGYDLVISVSHCVVKSVRVPPGTRHLCYCLTPMRYAWDLFDDYFGPDRVGPVGSVALRPVMAALARWDRATAGRVHRYLAISQHVARRIAVYYNRRSTIVYPPVDTDFFTPGATGVEPRFLVVSALVPYKRVDLAMRAARLAGVRLTVVGDGPERSALEPLAGHGVELVGRRSNEEIRELYRTSVAVVLPGEEDFGIVPVEAQACGRPVVALGRGGALDTVVPGVTGALVADSSIEAFAAAYRAALEHPWDPVVIRAHAERFSRPAFAAGVTGAVEELMSAPATERW